MFSSTSWTTMVLTLSVSPSLLWERGRSEALQVPPATQVPWQQARAGGLALSASDSIKNTMHSAPMSNLDPLLRVLGPALGLGKAGGTEIPKETTALLTAQREREEHPSHVPSLEKERNHSPAVTPGFPTDLAQRSPSLEPTTLLWVPLMWACHHPRGAPYRVPGVSLLPSDGSPLLSSSSSSLLSTSSLDEE